jgi:hypothetical protein
MIRLLLAGLLPSQNVRERQHWAARRRQEARWSQAIRCQVGLDDIATSRRRSVRVVSYRSRRITDYANLIGGAKGLIDCLVRAGLLVDDSDRWCSISYHQRLRSHEENPMPGRNTIEVYVEDAP